MNTRNPLKKYGMPILLFAAFEAVAVALWLTKDNPFYLWNFSYIGCSVALGLFLFIRGSRHARRVVQFLVGTYMLVYLGLICNENMQIEGFWYYLFTGVFEAATIHYAVAKIFGPLLFGRGWCGYACWTAMVLDLLPFKIPRQPRRKLGFIRYLVFAASLAFVLCLFLFHAGHMERIMFWSFLAGNLLYYGVGHWNAWFPASIYLQDNNKLPIQNIMRSILIANSDLLNASGSETDKVDDFAETIKYSTIVLTTVPVLCIYPFLQKYFVKGVMIGAVKG